jgi:hypothetical protein
MQQTVLKFICLIRAYLLRFSSSIRRDIHRTIFGKRGLTTSTLIWRKALEAQQTVAISGMGNKVWSPKKYDKDQYHKLHDRYMNEAINSLIEE